APLKSPFTPPPSGASNLGKNFQPKNVHARPRRPQDYRSRVVQRTTSGVPKDGNTQRSGSPVSREGKTQRTGGTEVTSTPKRKVVQQRSSGAPKPVGSPFRPPVQTEWRKDQRSNPPAQPLQEPALPERIRPSPPPNGRGGNQEKAPRRVTGPGTTLETSHQESRDMHESAPGVTPWTRYTARPKVRGQEEPNDTRSGRCGNLSYSPRSQICCQGRVQRRQGMTPACCGQQSFDSAYSKCCAGVVSLRTSQQADCP
ncbi:hypothetical protein EGW08_016275, partial [Elysia chlorotica]